MAAEPDPTLSPKEPATRVPLSIEKGIAALAMAALCLITLGNVIARYLTNYSFAFTEEYSIALMVVVTMLGASYAAARRSPYPASPGLPTSCRRRRRRIAEMLATLATIAMFGLLIVLGGKVVWDEYRFEVTSPRPRRAAVDLYAGAAAALGRRRRARRRARHPRLAQPPAARAPCHRAVVRRRCSLSRSCLVSRPVRARDADRGRARACRHARDLISPISASSRCRPAPTPASPSTRCSRCRCSCWSARSSTAPAWRCAWSTSPQAWSAAAPARSPRSR